MMLAAEFATALGGAVGAVTPTPGATPAFDENAITPGVTGFLVTAVFFVACALLVWSLIRRVSRLQQRERVRAELAAEAAARGAGGDEAAGDGAGSAASAGR